MNQTNPDLEQEIINLQCAEEERKMERWGKERERGGRGETGGKGEERMGREKKKGIYKNAKQIISKVI